jgi:antitoxin component YwqK of YwqJK toxin-antitoxin module
MKVKVLSKYSLFFSLILICINGYSQLEIEQSQLVMKDQKYLNGEILFSGTMILKYESGQTKQKIEVKDGVPNGIFIQYYKFPSYQPSLEKSLNGKINELNLSYVVCQKNIDSLKQIYESKSKIVNDLINENYGNFENFRTQPSSQLKGKAKKTYIKISQLNNDLSYWRNKSNDWQCRQIKKQIDSLETIMNKIYSKEFEYYQVNFQKEGSYKCFYNNTKGLSNPQIKEIGNYSKDKKVGGWQYWNEGETTPQIKEIGVYKNDKKDGKWEYYKDGILISEGFYLDDVKWGVWATYFKNKKLESKGAYKKPSSQSPKEIQIGDWLFYNENSELVKKVIYDSLGKFISSTQYNYNSGKIIEEVNLTLDGKKNGKYKTLYTNGKTKSEGNYIKDLMEGSWSFYFDNGRLNGTGSYLHGDGSDIGETGIPRNNRDGNWKIYTQTGALSQTSDWKDGKCTSRISYYPTGVKQEELRFTKQIKVPMQGPYVGTYLAMDELVNQYSITTWNENSIKVTEYYRIKTIDGDIHGPFKEFDANGKLSKEFTYSYGNKEGEFKIYESGILTTKGNICASCEDESKLIGDLYTYDNQNVKSHHFIEKNGTWYDRLNPNNPPTNPKDDLTERFKTSLPASFTVTQDGVSFLMRLEKNGTGMIMMGQYGPDNLLWSIKNGDQLSVYNTAFKAYTTYKITYSSKTTQNPVLEENSKGKVYYWNVKN